MISLDRNLSEIWLLINDPSSQSTDKHERIEFLSFQLQKIIDNIPTEDFKILDPAVVPPSWLQGGLKRFCRLRVHYIKMLTHIGTYASIIELVAQPRVARILVNSAVESVDLFVEMVNSGEISPLLLPSAIKILLASLSIMLFAVLHFPDEYGPLCSKPFHTAIDILSGMQDYIKDPILSIWATLEELVKIAEIIQMSPKRLSPLVNRKEETRNIDHHGELCGEDNLFEELRTPNSEFFSILEDFSMANTDVLYTDNVFG